MDASEAERKLRESERGSRPSNQERNEDVFSEEARGIIDPRSISFRAVKAVYKGVLSGELAAKTELFVAARELSEKIKEGATIQAFKVNEDGSIEGGAYYADRKVNFVPGKDAVRKLRRDWATEDIAQYVVPQIITDDRQIYLHHLDDVDVGGEFQGAFVSQARKTRFGDLVAALESHFGDEAGSAFVWLDIFSANQPVLTRPDVDTPLETIKAREEFMTHGLHRAISKFDKLVVFFDHWDKPAPLQRAWCVWEVLGAVKSERSLQIAITPGEEDRFMEQLLAASDEIARIVANNYDMRKAECYKREDLTMIQQAVEDIDGGFATLNTVVNGRVREWHRQMARVAVNEARVQKGDNIGLARVIFGAGSLVYAQGLYEDAMQHYKEALHIYKHESGGHNLSIANIGSVYRIQGHYEKALREYEEALLIRKKSLNDRHPDVAETLHNIAIVYRKQGHEKEALTFYREALSIRKEALGDRHPDVAATLNSIARVYHNQGCYEDALKSYREALAIKKAAFGDRHPAIADTLNNIGSVFCAQGFFDDALKYYKDTLSIYKEALGGLHLDHAGTLFNIGNAYFDRGDKSAALPYFKDADLYFSKILGPDHGYTTSVQECIRKCGSI